VRESAYPGVKGSQVQEHIAASNGPTAIPSKEQKIGALLRAASAREFESLTSLMTRMFGIDFQYVDSHPNNIKCIIKYKTFKFRNDLSISSKIFMIIHSIGHYYFITSAKRKNYDRYAYIYDQEGREATALHIYEHLGHAPHAVTEKMKQDRISFEIGANNFGREFLKHTGMEKLVSLVDTYQAGDINYILDVTTSGSEAIVRTDEDYLDRYICNDLTCEEDAHGEKIFEAEHFALHESLDWKYLSGLNLEVHFF
jgi:hypothetical protein